MVDTGTCEAAEMTLALLNLEWWYDVQ